jgi:hypothetical protein
MIKQLNIRRSLARVHYGCRTSSQDIDVGSRPCMEMKSGYFSIQGHSPCVFTIASRLISIFTLIGGCLFESTVPITSPM